MPFKCCSKAWCEDLVPKRQQWAVILESYSISSSPKWCAIIIKWNPLCEIVFKHWDYNSWVKLLTNTSIFQLYWLLHWLKPAFTTGNNLAAEYQEECMINIEQWGGIKTYFEHIVCFIILYETNSEAGVIWGASSVGSEQDETLHLYGTNSGIYIIIDLQRRVR